MSGNAPTRENSLKLSRHLPMRRVEGSFTVFELQHASQRATLAGIGTTGSLVAAVAALATLSTGVVAFHAWPTPHRASPQSLEIGPGAAGARTPLLAPAFGVGRVGSFPHVTLHPAVARHNEAAGPAAPIIRSVAPTPEAAHPGKAPSAEASKSDADKSNTPNTSIKVPSRLAAATTSTGKSTAAAVGDVTSQVSAAASKLSPGLGIGVQAGGVAAQVSVEQLTDVVAQVVGAITGPAQQAAHAATSP